MLNILLVFTGGTIGSASVNGTINTSKKQNYKLVELFHQVYPDKNNIHFKTIQPIDVLSENLHPSVWQILITAIEREGISQYDGIVVTHGTDTLAFTASALGLYFNQIKIPLLLVSSDYPLDYPQANGLSNFNCAIEFINQRQEAGVFVPYKNQNSAVEVHIGTRIASCLQLSSDFISVKSQAYLSFDQNQFYPQYSIGAVKKRRVSLKADFTPNILLIKPYPGLDYSHFNLEKVKAVIHDLYHSGTASSSDQWSKNASLVAFIETCNQKQIKLYMAPAFNDTDAYESTRSLLEQGAKMIWNMSIESAYVKLLLAYGNYSDQGTIDVFLSHNIAFECVDSS